AALAALTWTRSLPIAAWPAPAEPVEPDAVPHAAVRKATATNGMMNFFIALSITQRPPITDGLDGGLPGAGADLCGQSPTKRLESASVSQRPLDVDLRHPLPPVMAEVRIVERSRGLVSSLGDLRDQVLGRAGALEPRQARGAVARARRHAPPRSTTRAHGAPAPGDRRRH